MFGRCKVCEEKDKRIADLKEQLKVYTQPTPRINKYELQEDLVLSGGGDEIADPAEEEAERIKAFNIQRESDMLFSGNTDDIETPETRD